MSPGDAPFAYSRTEARERAAADFQFYAGLALPEVMEYELPAYYIALANILIAAARDNNTKLFKRLIRFALGLPRGFVKTTFVKILISYFITNDLCDFVLIVAATEFHAENIVSDVQSILNSPNIITLYGDWHSGLTVDSKAIKRSAYHNRPVIIAALGAGSSLRGLNIDNRRPDFVLCDDMQTKENDDSEAERNRLFVWFTGTLLKAVSPKWCLVAYLGNMYSENCILFKLKKHPQWQSLITGCILADGESLWPQLHPIEALYESFKHDELLGLAHIWFAEMMNDPVQATISLLSTSLKDMPPEYDVEPEGAFITVDPAGFRRLSDENVIAAHHQITVGGKTVGIVAEMYGEKMDPEKTIEKTIEMALRHNAPLIGIEDTGYQQTLQFWMEKKLKELHLVGTIIVVPLKNHKRKKAMRMKAFLDECVTENYFFKRPEDRQKVVYQALAYKPSKQNNKDDWIDCPAFALDIRNEYSDLISLMNKLLTGASQYSKASVVGNNTPF